MGSLGCSIAVSGSGDPEALQAAIWELVESWIGMYTAGPTYRAAQTYLADGLTSSREDDGTLYWMFSDLAGNRSMLAATWAHWATLAIASEWQGIRELAEQHDLAITSAQPELELGRTPGLLSMRNELWKAESDELVNDDHRMAIDQLDAEERGRYEEARLRCMCGPCTMLRPEPGFEKAMLGLLGNGDATPSAAWYIERWDRTTPEVLLALVNAAGTRMLRGPIESYAGRLASTAELLAPLLPTLGGTPRARAFYALVAIPLDDTQRAMLVRELGISLTGSGAATEAAAEVAGVLRGVDPELYEQVAAILDREVSDELRHQAVLGLVNAHFERAPSPTVRARLEREALLDTKPGKLADWFLRSFPIKS